VDKLKAHGLKVVGALGVTGCLVLYFRNPSFPTPDKLVIFLAFVFMMFSQALAMLKKLAPFIVILLVYESFRGVADYLNTNVNFTFMSRADELLFGGLPTIYLQNWWWHGQTMWYDFVFYVPYLLFFIIPIALALLIWKIREKEYWRFVSTFAVVSFLSFFTFLAFPAAPPWLASDQGYIEPTTRISSDVWFSLGLSDFPSVYDQISPNPVAAVPSLHAAWATLIAIFTFKLFGRRWGAASLIYPALIYVGTVYQGEHYAFDVAVGALYGIAAYKITPSILKPLINYYQALGRRWRWLPK